MVLEPREVGDCAVEIITFIAICVWPTPRSCQITIIPRKTMGRWRNILGILGYMMLNLIHDGDLSLWIGDERIQWTYLDLCQSLMIHKHEIQ